MHQFLITLHDDHRILNDFTDMSETNGENMCHLFLKKPSVNLHLKGLYSQYYYYYTTCTSCSFLVAVLISCLYNVHLCQFLCSYGSVYCLYTCLSTNSKQFLRIYIVLVKSIGVAACLLQL